MSKIVEEWKDIATYEGRYQISNIGRIKCIGRYRIGNSISTKKRFYKEKILICGESIHGYYLANLHKDSKVEVFGVHRLVALHFIPNPLYKKEVNHKNGNKLDNRVENLEFVTPSENSQHAYDTGLKTMDKFKKKVLMLSLDNKPLKKFDSQTEASRITGVVRTNIGKCCRGTRNTAGGYKWKFM